MKAEPKEERAPEAEPALELEDELQCASSNAATSFEPAATHNGQHPHVGREPPSALNARADPAPQLDLPPPELFLPPPNRESADSAAGGIETHVQLDRHLRVHVNHHGRQVDVRLDGSPETLAPFAGLGPELESALAEGGFNLGQFSSGEERQQRQEHQIAPDASPNPSRRVLANRRGFLIQRLA